MSIASPNQFDTGSATLFPYNTRPHSTASPVSGSILEYNTNNPAFVTYVPQGISTISLLTPPVFSTGQVSVVTNSGPAPSTLFKYIPIGITSTTAVAATAANPFFSSILGVPIASAYITPPGSAVPGSPNNSTIWGY